jgi:hypothetical protein
MTRKLLVNGPLGLAVSIMLLVLAGPWLVVALTYLLLTTPILNKT